MIQLYTKKANREIVIVKPVEKVYDKSGKDMKERLDECLSELGKSPLRGADIRPLTGQLRSLYRHRIGDRMVISRPIDGCRDYCDITIEGMLIRR